ncbi:uncharacterized protein LOC127245565 [Andrographis paniculata]|uniref:uncharacterized protein LOC127245565 n=1 Tax=Andrographis paniculata TaxID=175694 RepID=UPI0021E79700|nr:uncharacterized protein LOC127245565 [Andrographis paniculata]
MASKRSKYLLNHHKSPPQQQQPLQRSDAGADSDAKSNSDSDSATEDDVSTPVAAAATAASTVTPKKPRFTPTLPEPGSGPGGDGSECSSPSASAFIVMPSSTSSRPLDKTKMRKSAGGMKKFTEEEEIALLKGLAAFWANGRNNKWTEFHLFIKDDLPREFTKIQVSEKIRGLKRKYDTNLEKARANGGHLDFPDHHESALFELSKTLWGDEEPAENGQVEEKKPLVKKEQKAIAPKKIKKNAEEEDNGDEEKKILKKHKQQTEEEFKLAYPLLYMSFNAMGYPKFFKNSFHLIDREKAQELEEKWRELNAEELRLENKRIELTKRDLLNHSLLSK